MTSTLKVISTFIIVSHLVIHHVRPSPVPSSSTDSPEYRRDFIRNMTATAWRAYVEIGWTNGTIRPESRTPTSRNDKPARSIVASLTTLWVMGLRDEFEAGRAWVNAELHFKDIEYYLSVSSSVNDYLGAMLSCYALTGEQMFLDRAREIAEALEPAYNTATGLPMGRIKPYLKRAQVESQFLAEVGGQHIEYKYLADLTASPPESDSPFDVRWRRMRKFLSEAADARAGLPLSYLDVTTGEWKGEQVTIQAFGAFFFNYLLKAYLQSDGRDVEAMDMFKRAIQTADTPQPDGPAMFATSRSGLLHVRDYFNQSKRQGDCMTFEGCALGSLCSLGATELQKQFGSRPTIPTTEEDAVVRAVEQRRIARYWELARGITDTCTVVANRTATGLPLEKFYFNESEDGENSRPGSYAYYYLRPQLAESYLVLWRLTGEHKYRESAWRMVEALYQYARTESGGYSSLLDVNSVPPTLDDYQPPIFLGATLKYLYLTFAPADELPLSEWVFNAAGHPLPVCGKHVRYPKEMCTRGSS